MCSGDSALTLYACQLLELAQTLGAGSEDEALPGVREGRYNTFSQAQPQAPLLRVSLFT